ncbi:MAG: hypothetical protein LQ342_008017 [Letrouitia transgressa]|nr:MAG: hypothetical protein LQ342_008017 [Letrouitia transgressa]
MDNRGTSGRKLQRRSNSSSLPPPYAPSESPVPFEAAPPYDGQLSTTSSHHDATPPRSQTWDIHSNPSPPTEKVFLAKVPSPSAGDSLPRTNGEPSSSSRGSSKKPPKSIFGSKFIAKKIDRNIDLYEAAGYGTDAEVAAVIERGANPNFRSMGLQSSPLHQAAKYGRNDIVDRLLRAGANIAWQDRFGRTPLHEAIFHNHQATASLLIQARSAIVQQADDIRGWTPLHEAAFHGHEPLVSLLVNAGADLEAKDFEQQTSLQLAANARQIGTMELLYHLGANLDAEDGHHLTPLLRALLHQEEAVWSKLLELGAYAGPRAFDGRDACEFTVGEDQAAYVKLGAGCRNPPPRWGVQRSMASETTKYA